MRKMLAVLLAVCLLLGMAACGSNKADIPDEVQAEADLVLERLTGSDSTTAGGWTRQEDPTLTDAEAETFQNAVAAAEEEREQQRRKNHTDQASDSEEAEQVLTPIALEAAQVAAGVNYCFLCKAESAEDAGNAAQPEYLLVYIYRDPEGNAAITDTESLQP